MSHKISRFIAGATLGLSLAGLASTSSAQSTSVQETQAVTAALKNSILVAIALAPTPATVEQLEAAISFSVDQSQQPQRVPRRERQVVGLHAGACCQEGLEILDVERVQCHGGGLGEAPAHEAAPHFCVDLDGSRLPKRAHRALVRHPSFECLVQGVFRFGRLEEGQGLHG